MMTTADRNRGSLLRYVAIAGLATGIAFAVACGSRARGFDDGAGAGADASDESATFADASLIDSGTMIGACHPCSSDLHSVTDCDGKVLKTCPADQGCSPDGTCVAACASASANKSSIGCDYYAVMPPVFTQSCFAAFVANTWGSPVTVSVERGGTPLNIASIAYTPSGSGTSLTLTPLTSGKIDPQGIAIIFLSSAGSDCPAGTTVGVPGGASVSGTGKGQAFHITTSAPVVAYDIFPYGGGSSAVTSATLLLPTSAWDVNYVGVTGYKQTVTGLTANPWLSLVASEDGTSVTINPTVAITAGTGVSAGPMGTPTTYNLMAGEVLQFSQPTDLTGSAIESTKPVGLWGGNTCTDLPDTTGACDGMHQQIPPVKALGNEYAAVRYRNRIDGMEETPPWRLVGAVDGTILTYEPAAPAGAPTTVKSGELIEFPAAGPFVIKSQDSMHPFYFGAHMTGCFAIGGYGSPIGCAGDPEFVNVVPGAQYLSSYVFFTDPTYPETNLVFVREKAHDGTFKDVKLDCVGVLAGWQPVGSSGNYEYVRADLVRGNFVKQGMCDNGRHEASSDGPFGLTVWGWGTNATSVMSEAVSYAYPAGLSVRPINSVVVPATPK